MEIRRALVKETDRLSLFALTFTYGQLKIKSPLWNQAWNSIPLVKLESIWALKLFPWPCSAPLRTPDKPLGGSDVHSDHWQFPEY